MTVARQIALNGQQMEDALLRQSKGQIVNFTDANKPTPEAFGTGPIWIDGVQYWSDGFGYAKFPEKIDRIEEIQSRLYKSKNNELVLNYIVTGDSTREIPTLSSLLGGSHSTQYYIYLLQSFNITDIFDNNRSGMSTAQWTANAFPESYSAAIAQISGTGLNSILEFSLGLNDHPSTLGNIQAVTTVIRTALTNLLTAKPDLTILLVSPPKTDGTIRNDDMRQIYFELAKEFGLPVIDGHSIMQDVHGDAAYYNKNTDVYPNQTLDGTHPGIYGQRRLLNKIVSSIVPDTMRDLVPISTDLSNLSMSAIVEIDKYWSTGNGNDLSGVNWRRLAPISVTPCTELIVSHQGERVDIVCMDGSGLFIEKLNISAAVTQYRPVQLLHNCYEVRINLSHQGATYDALNDVPSVYSVDMTPQLINKGLGFLPQKIL